MTLAVQRETLANAVTSMSMSCGIEQVRRTA